MRLLLIAFISSLLINAHAYTGNSLSWQKIVLEEKIQQKISQSLLSLLKENQFLVQVEVEVNEPGAPNFGGNNSTGPRVSDLDLSDSRGDYIAFSKVGLEVPVLDKFMDDDRARLVNLYRFNESFDLFKNITSIKLFVSLSDQLPADLVEIAKKVVSAAKINVAGVKPTVSFESLKLEWEDPRIKAEREKQKAAEAKREEILRKNENEEPKIWKKDWLEWASRWGNAVGLIFAALTLAIVALMMFRQWREFMDKFVQSSKAQNEQKAENEGKDSAAASVAASAEQDLTSEESMQLQQDFERFRNCLTQHPGEAANLVRSWLADGDVSAVQNLRAVAQQLSEIELNGLFSLLTDEQRDKWRSHLDKRLVGKELIDVNRQVAQDVLRSLLVPSRIKDGDLQNLLVDLSVRHALLFLEKKPEHTGVVMNILSANLVSKMIAAAENDLAETLLEAGASYDSSRMQHDLDSLKTALTEYKREISPSAFATRLVQMIPLATPSKESALYRALAKAGGKDLIGELAKKAIPAELILKMPPAFLKETMAAFPMAKRVELLFILDEDSRHQLLEIFASPGTPARDMIDMELESIQSDPGRISVLEKSRDSIWETFVNFSRGTLSTSPHYHVDAETLVLEWSDRLVGKMTVIEGGRAAS